MRCSILKSFHNLYHNFHFSQRYYFVLTLLIYKGKALDFVRTSLTRYPFKYFTCSWQNISYLNKPLIEINYVPVPAQPPSKPLILKSKPLLAPQVIHIKQTTAQASLLPSQTIHTLVNTKDGPVLTQGIPFTVLADQTSILTKQDTLATLQHGVGHRGVVTADLLPPGYPGEGGGVAGGRGVRKSGHNAIEKRYRSSINDRLEFITQLILPQLLLLLFTNPQNTDYISY